MVIQLPESIATTIHHFTGRSWLLPPLLNWFERSHQRLFIITGAPGTGKSTIAAWLAGAGSLPTDPEASHQLAYLRSQVGATHFCIAASGTTDPRNLAKSIAEQLTQTIQGFSDALIETLPEQIQIVVKQTVGTANDSNLTGVQIESLNMSALGDEASFNRLVREPLKQLYKDGYNQPILLLIDSLDEAATYTGNITIVDLLAKLTDIHEQVRFLLTTRPDPRILKYFPDSPTFDLIGDAPATSDDIQQYAYERLSTLQASQRSHLAGAISQAAEGIFLYAYLVIENLLPHLSEAIAIETLSLPKGLSGLYQQFLNRELGKNEDRWYDLFKPLLGAIAVSQGDGLTQKQLAGIARKDIDEVERSLRKCAQYLRGTSDGCFRVFHKSFADFLLEDTGNTDYHINPATMHQHIADYYWQPSQPLEEIDWHHLDNYAYYHLADHLLKGDRKDDLCTLLTTSPRWMEAKTSMGQTASYLSDIRLAWQQAEEECRQQPLPKEIALQCRYALMTASVNSLAGNYPPSLLAALLLDGQRTLPEVLTYIRQNTDPDKRAEAYLSLLKLPSLLADRQPEILQEGLLAASKCYWAWTRSKFQLAFARYLTEMEQQQLQREVFAGMQKLQSEWEKTNTLVEIAPDLPDCLLPETLESIWGIEDDYNREKALVALLPRLTGELLDSVIQHCDMASLRCKPALLAAQISTRSPVEQDSLMEQAFNETRTITDEYWQAMALKSLVPYLNESMLSEAIAIASSQASPNLHLDDVRTKLILRLIILGKFTEALHLVRLIRIPYRMVEALFPLYPYLSPAERQEVIDIVKEIKDPYWYAEVFGALAIALPDSNDSLIQQALAAMLIADTDEQAQTLGKLAIHLSDTDTDTELRQVFQSLLAIQNSGKRANVLIELAPHLPEDLIDEAFEVAWCLSSDKDEAKAMTALAPRLPMNLRKRILQQTGYLFESNEQLLPAIAFDLPEQVFATLERISDEETKVKILANLVCFLPDDLLDEALEIARSITDKSNRAFLLAVVASKLIAIGREPPRSEIRETIQYIKRWEFADRARHAIATYLFKEKDFGAALEMLAAMQDDRLKANTLELVVPSLPEEFLLQIPPLIQSFQWADAIPVLAVLPSNLSTERLQEIIDAIQNIIQNSLTDDYTQLVKEGFVPLLKYPKHLSDIQQSRLYNRMVEMAGLEEKFKNRLHILAAIAPLLPDDIIRQSWDLLYPAWKDTMKQGAELDRTTMLAAVGMLAPFILKIGGVDSVREIFHAVRDVGRWWQ